MIKQNLLVIGAGGHGRVVEETAMAVYGLTPRSPYQSASLEWEFLLIEFGIMVNSSA